MLTKWGSYCLINKWMGMDTIINTIPGYRVYEYLLVLNTHEDLRNKIMQIKKDFFEKYEASTAMGKPYVPLVSFVQYGLMEDRIVNRLRVVAMGATPFKVELKDFGSFPSHTIYINVATRVPVQDLVKTIRHETQRLMKLNEDNKPHFILEPHLTIARKLKPWQYEKGWLEYSNKDFSGRFIADSMVLLKRPSGEMKYQVANRFEFLNMPVATKQGELFG